MPDRFDIRSGPTDASPPRPRVSAVPQGLPERRLNVLEMADVWHPAGRPEPVGAAPAAGVESRHHYALSISWHPRPNRLLASIRLRPERCEAMAGGRWDDRHDHVGPRPGLRWKAVANLAGNGAHRFRVCWTSGRPGDCRLLHATDLGAVRFGVCRPASPPARSCLPSFAASERGGQTP